MSRTPKVEYVTADDGAHIAYQVVGDGSRDLVFIPGWISNLDLLWDNPIQVEFLGRLAAFSRLILLDKRGTGLSDPIARYAPPTLERRMDDVRAVMDAVGSSEAAFLGGSEGGPTSILFAATYPSRTVALILFGAYARHLWAPDYRIGLPEAELEEMCRLVEEHWGEAPILDRLMPGLTEVPEAVADWGRFERLSASPATAGALLRMAFEGDVRAVLSAVTVPTLILHRTDDRMVPVEHGRYLAEHMPNSRFVELPGAEHIFWDITDRIADEVELFLTGEQTSPEHDRQLATVLFTDIVGSTEQAAQMGDQRWRQILNELDEVMAGQVQRFRGRLVKSTGDGHLATFDGPGRAIGCATSLNQRVARFGIEMRSGLHTGEIELRGEDVGGIAVHVAARVMAYARPRETLVSAAVPPLVLGSGIEFDERGEHDLKGVPGTWKLFAVRD
jgi:pimeloyl-ACP methyl ester carboxylesterase